MAWQPSFTQFEKLLDSLTQVVCAIDHEGHFVYINHASLTILGYQPEELIGKCCYDLIVEGDKQASLQAVDQFLADDKSIEFENQYYHKDGSVVTLSWIGRRDWQNNLIYSAGKDVTQKKKREKEMEMLSLIAKQTVNNIIVMDPEGHITWVNAAFTHTTGYTFEEAIGRVASELLLGPESDHKLIGLTRERLKRGEALAIEMLGYTKQKQPYWSNVQFQPMFDKEGILTQIVSIHSDITEKKKLQTQLEQEIEKRQKRITAAVINAQENERAQLGRELHDNVNQVLTTVKLFNEIIAENVTNHKELVHKSTYYLQTCIDEIRRISKRLSIPSLTEVGLFELIRELVDSISLTNKFEVTYSLKGMHALSISQELQLAIYRIMQEQLNNIIKHANATLVTISLACEGDQLFLSIKDDGKGFDLLTKRQGIGITNIRSRAESLDGSFCLEAAPGKGCLLKITFPLKGEAVLN